jgi:hypothetical protein
MAARVQQLQANLDLFRAQQTALLQQIVAVVGQAVQVRPRALPTLWRRRRLLRWHSTPPPTCLPHAAPQAAPGPVRPLGDLDELDAQISSLTSLLGARSYGAGRAKRPAAGSTAAASPPTQRVPRRGAVVHSLPCNGPACCPAVPPPHRRICSIGPPADLPPTSGLNPPRPPWPHS